MVLSLGWLAAALPSCWPISTAINLFPSPFYHLNHHLIKLFRPVQDSPGVGRCLWASIGSSRQHRQWCNGSYFFLLFFCPFLSSTYNTRPREPEGQEPTLHLVFFINPVEVSEEVLAFVLGLEEVGGDGSVCFPLATLVRGSCGRTITQSSPMDVHTPAPPTPDPRASAYLLLLLLFVLLLSSFFFFSLVAVLSIFLKSLLPPVSYFFFFFFFRSGAFHLLKVIISLLSLSYFFSFSFLLVVLSIFSSSLSSSLLQ